MNKNDIKQALREIEREDREQRELIAWQRATERREARAKVGSFFWGCFVWACIIAGGFWVYQLGTEAGITKDHISKAGAIVLALWFAWAILTDVANFIKRKSGKN